MTSEGEMFLGEEENAWRRDLCGIGRTEKNHEDSQHGGVWELAKIRLHLVHGGRWEVKKSMKLRYEFVGKLGI